MVKQDFFFIKKYYRPFLLFLYSFFAKRNNCHLKANFIYLPKGKNMAIHIYLSAANESTLQKITVPFESLPPKKTAEYLFSLPEIPPRPLCTGMGKCGRCKIQYLSPAPELVPLERILLTKEEQEQNIRLACKHPLENNTEFRILNDLQEHAAGLEIEFSDTACDLKNTLQAVLFVDLGTTSVAFEVHAEESNTLLAQGKLLNPQMFAGADVMARLHYRHFTEKQSPSRLQSVVCSLLREICTDLQKKNIFIQKIYLAANPSMTAIFLGKSAEGLMEAPYYLENKGHEEFHLPYLPPVYIPPQISPFVGADAAAGLAYILDKFPRADNFLLADLGTNGEFIFYGKGKILAASVPLGPALEGVGMRCGSAVHGKGENIIVQFSLTPFGLSPVCSGTPLFISGTGYLSLIHILLSAGILGREGLFLQNQAPSPLNKKITANLTETNGEKRLYVAGSLYVCPEDIENILKVKAAFSSAMELFLQKSPINQIFLSGALSSHIPLDILENLGFLPKNAKSKTQILGNTSLLGTIVLHQNPRLADKVAELAGQADIIDLTGQDAYNSLYINNMHF